MLGERSARSVARILIRQSVRDRASNPKLLFDLVPGARPQLTRGSATARRREEDAAFQRTQRRRRSVTSFCTRRRRHAASSNVLHASSLTPCMHPPCCQCLWGEEKREERSLKTGRSKSQSRAAFTPVMGERTLHADADADAENIDSSRRHDQRRGRHSERHARLPLASLRSQDSSIPKPRRRPAAPRHHPPPRSRLV